MENIFDINTYNYDLPEGLIAADLGGRRESAKMMIVDYEKREFDLKHTFVDLSRYLDEQYVVVLNNTKVYPASLNVVKKESGGKWEMLFLEEKEEEIWEVITSKAKRVRVGDVFCLSGDQTVELKVVSVGEGGLRRIKVDRQGKEWQELLWKYGKMPLPPYVKKDETVNYKQEYQTVFARREGSVAAPTAGFHFSNELIEGLKQRGVIFEEVTLHVGLGTFLPVKEDDIRNHKIHRERIEYDQEVWERLLKYKKSGKKILAVGTTAVRYLESLAAGLIGTKKSETNLFVYPGYKFNVVDEMITNFHLPKSTLLMLVAAFLYDRGKFEEKKEAVDFLLRVYQEAIREKWRFYSFGDGMWLKK